MILTLKWEDSDTILLRLKINQYRHDGGKIIPFRFLLLQERIFMILRWIIFSGWTGSLTKHVRLPATFCHAPLTFYWKPQVTCTAQHSSGAPHWQVKVDGVGRFFIPLCSLCLSESSPGCRSFVFLSPRPRPSTHSYLLGSDSHKISRWSGEANISHFMNVFVWSGEEV